MNVLVACEESQEVCKAFRARGHLAFSCDLQECSGGHPEWHIQGDALQIINGNTIFKTMDGLSHYCVSYGGRWDLIIAHPPCTYLSNVATRHYSLKCCSVEKVIARWEERARASVFFMQFIAADCDRIAVENPIGFMNTVYRKPDQIVHPWMFAESEQDVENYVTKATCFWLKGLPKLSTNDLSKPDNRVLYGAYSNGKAKTWEDSYARSAKARSRTFSGIAKAMSEQWG